jgi:hypothetical protein
MKRKNVPGKNDLNKDSQIVITRIRDDLFSVRVNNEGIHPLLLPGLIGTAKKKEITYDILDMKSKKLIKEIDETITGLSLVNPVEGGSDAGQADLTGQQTRKKKEVTNLPAESTGKLSDYESMLADLKMIVVKLSKNRERIYKDSFETT